MATQSIVWGDDQAGRYKIGTVTLSPTNTETDVHDGWPYESLHVHIQGGTGSEVGIQIPDSDEDDFDEGDATGGTYAKATLTAAGYWVKNPPPRWRLGHIAGTGAVTVTVWATFE